MLSITGYRLTDSKPQRPGGIGQFFYLSIRR